jgi:predicted nucleic acid-binding protein
LDSSAIVKLVVAEPESAALRRYLRRRRPLVSSALAKTEVLRALLPAGPAAVAAGRAVLATIELVRISDRIVDTAASLLPTDLRSLDAIHLATAQHLQPDLGPVVAYDERLLAAAAAQRLKTASPR